MITQSELKELLHYDEFTGDFTWIKKTCRCVRVGKKAGYKDKKYSTLRINNKQYLAHRLAWLYVNGKFPIGILDHKDRNGHNNQITNLREATVSQNAMNAYRADNIAKCRGVYYESDRQKFRVSVHVNKVRIYIGRFDTLEAAKEARIYFAKQHHGEFYFDDN